MARYAEGTSVPVAKTRTELEELLAKRGAQEFGTLNTTGQDGRPRAVLVFRLEQRLIRFTLPMPSEQDVRLDGRGRLRAEGDKVKALEQATRERWRALYLAVKSKLVAVDAGIETVEQAFLAQIVIPGGGTVGERVGAELAAIYAGKEAPRFLLGPGEPS